MTDELYEYTFIERDILANFLAQVPTVTDWRAGLEWKFSLSLTGPKLDVSKTRPAEQSSIHNDVMNLVAFLHATEKLLTRRPYGRDDPRMLDAVMGESCGKFVVETMSARKVIFTTEHLNGIPGLSQFAVWVSDPNPDDFTKDPYERHGTFLYLTESYWNDDGHHMISGCSALQAVMNIAEGRDLSAGSVHGGEPLGIGKDQHPIDRLRELGASVGVEQRIRAFYRTRYFTDEQCYIVDGETRRVHDLLGYPISIARILS